MPRIAVVFPGQGAQYAGMGKDLAQNFDEAALIYEQADEIAGYKLSELCFYDQEKMLNQTKYAQPALLTTSLAVFEVVKKHGINPVIMAGLSLGEYTALVASGAISFKKALLLVQIRGSLMQEAVPPGKGAMAAVMGLDNNTIEEACKQAVGIVNIANYNAPGQTVISGESEAVSQVVDILRKQGGRVKILAVSVPSHSQLMYNAAMNLKPHLEEISFKPPAVDVVSNVNAQGNSFTGYKDLLVKQLFSPVLWEQSIRYMMNKTDYFIEIGPGSTLSGLIKRIDRSRILGHIEDTKTLAKVLKKVGL
jgi:[acyl-carrier-protein] S-malonyltransferase